MELKQNILRQFEKPRGFMGSVAGYIMAHRPSNIARNHWMIEQLQLKPDDRLLELGYGPGLALEQALHTITSGMVVGIDHSDPMHKQASRRLAAALASGRVQLRIGDIEALPPLEHLFDHICSANVVQFWRDPVTVFAYLRRWLAEGGDLATLYMPRNRGAISAHAYRKADQITDWLRQAGFSEIRTVSREFDGLAAVCVIAR